MLDSSSVKIEVVTKMDAARRQLATAIDLWFYGKDQVSVHALAFAAYEIIDAVSKKKGRTADLLFDSLVVKDEARPAFKDALKAGANFFKHASKDPDATIKLLPISAEMFMLFAILGLTTMNIQVNDHESGLMTWFMLKRPDLLKEGGIQTIEKLFPIEFLAQLDSIDKADFFEAFLEARSRNSSHHGIIN
jgi:hypothetical protein